MVQPFFPFTSVKFINVWCHSFWKREPINMYKVKKSSSLCINIYSWQLCLHLLNSYIPHLFFFFSYSTPYRNWHNIYEFLWSCAYVCMHIPAHILICVCIYLYLSFCVSLSLSLSLFLGTNDWIILPTFCILLIEHFPRTLMTAYLELGWAIRQAHNCIAPGSTQGRNWT